MRRIAVGGMAEIYLAKSLGAEGFQKEVVIKLILPSYSEDEAFVTMFIDEARIAARLRHQNIVQIFDFDRFDDCYYIAMEYVEGRDLRKVMDRALKTQKRISPLLAVQAAAEVCAGLRYAHTRKGEDGKPLDIIHRDVSPHNVLVSYAGELKITDFGIAKAAARSTKTRAGTVKGKCAYMSPEQARGKPLDPRSDMFALCAITWEMLTGRRPFEGDTDFEILNNVLNASLPPPSLFNPAAPRELDAIILKGLRKDRDERYPDMAALEKDLRQFVFKHASTPDEAALGPLMQELFAEEMSGEHELPVPVAVPAPARTPTPRAAVPTPGPRPAAPTPAPRPAATTSTPSKADGTLMLSDEEQLPAPGNDAETVKVDAPAKAPKTIPVGMLRQELDDMIASGAVQPPAASQNTADQVSTIDSGKGRDAEVPTMALSEAAVSEALSRAAQVRHTSSHDDLDSLGATGNLKIGTGSRPGVKAQRSRTWLWVAMGLGIVAAGAAAVWISQTVPNEPGSQVQAVGPTGSGSSHAPAQATPAPAPAPTVTAPPVPAPVTPPAPTPPAAEKARAVILEFDVTPASTTVRVNGEAVVPIKGKRIVAGRFKIGDSVEVAASAPGHADFHARIALASEVEVQKIQLDPAKAARSADKKPAASGDTGMVNINARPWADVYFKGRKLGTTPLRFEAPVGKQTFTLKKDVVQKVITVTIEKGQVAQPGVVDM